MTGPPTVSVVIPCYNAAPFLRETLDSALAQTHPPLEVLVIDDGSTDDSVAIAKSYGDLVRVLRQANAGAGAARAAGILAAKGDYILFNDADDRPPPWKLKFLRDGLLKYPQCLMAGGATATLDRCPGEPGELGGEAVDWEVIDAPYLTMLHNCRPFADAMNLIVRREAAVRTVSRRPFPRLANDYDLQLRIAALGPAARTRHVTSYYQPGSGGLTESFGRWRQTAWARLAGERVLPGLSGDGAETAARIFRGRLLEEWAGIYVRLLLEGDRRLARQIFRLAARHLPRISFIKRLSWAVDSLESAERSRLPAALRLGIGLSQIPRSLPLLGSKAARCLSKLSRSVEGGAGGRAKNGSSGQEAFAVASRNGPAVSVLMPVHNAERYLSRAVTSVVTQTFDNWEMIAIDDGSTDRSAELLARFAAADARVRLIARKNRGVCFTRTELLRMARAPLIAWMDADDISRPNRLRSQVSFLDDHPEVVAAGARVLLIDAAGWPICEHAGTTFGHDAIDAELLTGGWPIVQGASMMRTAAVRSAGGYTPDSFPSEDHDLFLRLAEVGHLANVEDFLLDYRQHVLSVCHERFEEQERRLASVVAAARHRRGLDVVPPSPAGVSVRTAGLNHRRWAAMASTAGYRMTAFKHATLSCVHEPADLTSWRFAATAAFGRECRW